MHILANFGVFLRILAFSRVLLYFLAYSCIFELIERILAYSCVLERIECIHAYSSVVYSCVLVRIGVYLSVLSVFFFMLAYSYVFEHI